MGSSLFSKKSDCPRSIYRRRWLYGTSTWVHQKKISENTPGGSEAGKGAIGKVTRRTMNKQFIGSNFDDFLAEEGLLTEAQALAVKRVLAYQIEQLMISQNLSKTVMAQRMNTSRAALNRLLDPANPSVTLQTLERAASVLGKRLQVELV